LRIKFFELGENLFFIQLKMKPSTVLKRKEKD